MKQNRYPEAYNWDNEFTHSYVICNHCALVRNGLIYANAAHLDLFTKHKELDKISTLAFTYYYNPDIDYEFEVRPSKSNPLLLLPTAERAIAECIKYIDNVDEGLLIEALKSYLDNFWNDRLYQICEHFGISRETIDWWLEEARNDYEV